MSENKTSRYFKYAIGEILLVVIGILIALQVNNFNENSKIKTEEKILITGLIQNIEDDIKSLISIKKRDSIFIDANRILLSALKNDSIRGNKPLLKQKIYEAAFVSSCITVVQLTTYGRSIRDKTTGDLLVACGYTLTSI